LPSKRHEPGECLADIVESAERIEGCVAVMERAAFERDGRTRDAVERCLERVCGVVHRFGDRAEALMPGHPWGASAAWGTGCATPTTA
jgi:uncharacterized protein with HEPN domain